ncbi:hypothetical protein [Streptosporangium sp. NPDC002721]
MNTSASTATGSARAAVQTVEEIRSCGQVASASGMQAQQVGARW